MKRYIAALMAGKLENGHFATIGFPNAYGAIARCIWKVAVDIAKERGISMLQFGLMPTAGMM